MEWFVTANANLPVAELQRQIRLETLAAWCAAPPTVAGEAGALASHDWTAWRVHREVIRDGLRFTLPGAEHAPQWTLTAGTSGRPGTVSVHCTLNSMSPDAATCAAIEAFMAAWREGLEAGAHRLQTARAEKAAATEPPCAPWFG